MIDTLSPRSTFVGQTEKFVRKPGRREYITTSEEGNEPAFLRRVSDEAYAEALSGKVIQCIDIAVVNENGHVLIGRRDQEPHAGDWVIGGAMRAGESSSLAAQRHMERELKMQTNPSGFQEVGNYIFTWDTRAQEPTVNEDGDSVVSCHMSSMLKTYSVAEADVDLTSFNEEYTQIAWTDPLAIINASEGTYHPCLVDMMWDLLDQQSTPEAPKTKEQALHLNRMAGLAIETHWSENQK